MYLHIFVPMCLIYTHSSVFFRHLSEGWFETIISSAHLLPTSSHLHSLQITLFVKASRIFFSHCSSFPSKICPRSITFLLVMLFYQYCFCLSGFLKSLLFLFISPVKFLYFHSTRIHFKHLKA